MTQLAFLEALESVIDARLKEQPDASYTASLAARGVHRIAQKVGEEGVEVALAAVTQKDDLLISECADLLFHVLVLLRVKGFSLADVAEKLEQRHAAD
ncbi:MAG: phosphoribosyl-ATP diphosphatase [Gammaproteobacteria bacterium]|jgi:phosphoribosyl-ATP pyrophosphohydrolase/phosphoribosyl-AMP cyclohydrolase